MAKAGQAGVVVLGSHGRTDLHHARLGSVSAPAAQHSKTSVLTVNRQNQPTSSLVRRRTPTLTCGGYARDTEIMGEQTRVGGDPLRPR